MCDSGTHAEAEGTAACVSTPDSQDGVCTDHPNYPICYYCPAHEQFLCSKDIHCNCAEIQSLYDLEKSLATERQNMLISLTDDQTTLIHLNEHDRSSKSNVNTDLQRASKQVLEECQRLSDVILDFGKKIIEEINQLKVSDLKNSNREKKITNEIIHSIKEIIVKITDNTDRKIISESDIKSHKEQMEAAEELRRRVGEKVNVNKTSKQITMRLTEEFSNWVRSCEQMKPSPSSTIEVVEDVEHLSNYSDTAVSSPIKINTFVLESYATKSENDNNPNTIRSRTNERKESNSESKGQRLKNNKGTDKHSIGKCYEDGRSSYSESLISSEDTSEYNSKHIHSSSPANDEDNSRQYISTNNLHVNTQQQTYKANTEPSVSKSRHEVGIEKKNASAGYKNHKNKTPAADKKAQKPKSASVGTQLNRTLSTKIRFQTVGKTCSDMHFHLCPNVVFAEKDYKNLELLGIDGTVKNSTPLQFEPARTCVYGGQIAVVFSNNSKLGIFDSVTMEHIDYIKSDRQYFGIGRGNGGFYVTDWNDKHVRFITDDGKVKYTSKNTFDEPWSIVVDEQTENIFVSDWQRNSIHCLDPKLQTERWTFKHKQLKCPKGMCIVNDSIYVCCYSNDRLTEISKDGHIRSVLEVCDMKSPLSVSFGEKHELLVVCTETCGVFILSLS